MLIIPMGIAEISKETAIKDLEIAAIKAETAIKVEMAIKSNL
jgi:hypothetical protein